MSEGSFRKNSYGRRDDNQGDRQSYGDRQSSYPQQEGNYQRPYRPVGNRPYQPKGSFVGSQNGYSTNKREGRPFGNPQGGRPFSSHRSFQGGNRDNRFGKSGRFSSHLSERNDGEGYPKRPFFTQQGEARHSPSSFSHRPYGGQQESHERNVPRPYSPRPQRGRIPIGKRRINYKEEILDPSAPLRLNKFLANAGVCSRRDADKFINAGVVTVNGKVVTELGTKIYRTDEVHFHGEVIRLEKKVYVLLNKPKGYVTTSDDPQNRKTVMDLVRNACPERIYPVGRLDRNTTGVLLLTNDGELASKLTHPKYFKKKIYHVFLDQNVTAAHLRQITEGITLEDGEIKADAVDYASPTDKKQVGIEIHSGRNRIVRRIFESLGYHVTKLDRVYFSGLTKKNLKRGDWRYLTEQEVTMLRMGAFE